MLGKSNFLLTDFQYHLQRLFNVIHIINAIALWISVGTAACTTDAWRAGVQESAKQQCLQAPIGEQQRCLDRLNQIEKH